MQAAIEATKAMAQTMSEAAGPNERNGHLSQKTWRPEQVDQLLKQQALNWKAHNKYNELLNFEVEV